MSMFVHVTRKGLWGKYQDMTIKCQSVSSVSLAPMTWSMLKSSKRCKKCSEILTDKEKQVFMGNLPRHPEPTCKVNALYLMVLLQEMLKSYSKTHKRKTIVEYSANDGYGSKNGTCDSR